MGEKSAFRRSPECRGVVGEAYFSCGSIVLMIERTFKCVLTETTKGGKKKLIIKEMFIIGKF